MVKGQRTEVQPLMASYPDTANGLQTITYFTHFFITSTLQLLSAFANLQV
jgi:hypothetical protein